jgi:hypothetical protein
MYIPIGDSSSASISVSTSSFERLLRHYETNLFMFFEKHQIVITINYIIYNILNLNSIL